MEGKSDKPVCLKIEDEKVSIEDASHVWGKGTFDTNATLARENGPEFEYMSAVVGEDYTREDLEFDSERISQLLRVMTAVSFKLNLGSANLRQDHDQPSDWVFDKDPDFKPFEEGTVKLDREDYAKALDMWYEAMGWDKETGIPTRATLEKFDLGDCADKLEALGLI